jgi:hypothetical protein
MKKIVALLFFALLLSGCGAGGNNLENSSNRFEISASGGLSPTILLDKKTGNTWRSIYCPEEGKKEGTVMNCWQMMTHEDTDPALSDEHTKNTLKNYAAFLKTQEAPAKEANNEN